MITFLNFRKTNITILLLILSFNICTAKEYFVDVIGDDNAPGSFDHPWSNIEESIQKLQPGDVLNIRGGIYRQKFDVAISGTPDKWITIRNYQDEHVNIWYSVDLSQKEKWITNGNNIWSTPEKIFNKTINYDLATIWHDDQSHWSLKKDSPEELEKQWDFCQNNETGQIEVYSLSNPATLAEHIEAPRSRPVPPFQFVTNISGSFILMEGIHYKYINVHGIKTSGGSHHIIFRNGAISHGGGGNISPSYNPPVRWGDCVDVTNDSHHIWFENSVFGEYPDGTLTNQGNYGKQRFLYFRNNYIYNSTCGIHCWFGESGKDNNGVELSSIYYEGNTFENIGKGWFEDKAVMIGGIQFIPRDHVITKDIYIRDNLFINCGTSNYKGDTWRGVNCPINIGGGELTISDNIINGSPSYGIFTRKVHQEFRGKVYNNLIINCSLDGIKMNDGLEEANFSVYNNQLIHCGVEDISDSVVHNKRSLNYFSGNNENLSIGILKENIKNKQTIRFLLNGYFIHQSPILKILEINGKIILECKIVTPPGSVNVWGYTDRYGKKLKAGKYRIEFQSGDNKIVEEISIFM